MTRPFFSNHKIAMATMCRQHFAKDCNYSNYVYTDSVLFQSKVVHIFELDSVHWYLEV